MSELMIDEVLRGDRAAIAAGVRARLRGDEAVGRLAARRGLGEGDLLSQVVGFWLQGIGSDLALGSTATMEQNLHWLVGLRAGHELPFDDEMVGRMFDAISAEIEVRLGSDAQRAEYAAYRQAVERLIVTAFPAGSGGRE